MKPWTKKYQPKHSSEVIGQKESILRVKSYLSTKKPILLYGPTGSGKTSAVYAIGKELSKEVFEINSSDARNKKQIESSLGTTIVQHSLFSKSKIILIDDVDALSGTKDRGGLTALIGLFPKTKFPMVLTCTDPFTDKLSKLRKKCTLIEFAPVNKQEIFTHLKDIATNESIIYSDEDVQKISKWAKGDLRAAVNDLQTHSITGSLVVDDQGERNKHEDIHFALRKIFKSHKWSETYNVFWKIDMDTNKCILWLDENLPKEYDSESLKKAYNHLSRADVFNGRIRRWQYWRFLVYINALITSGIAISKTETNPNFIEYKRTKRILKLWMAKQRYGKKRSICEKIAEKTHTSKKEAIKSTFPYMKKLLLRNDFIQELELDEDELAWLQK